MAFIIRHKYFKHSTFLRNATLNVRAQRASMRTRPLNASTKSVVFHPVTFTIPNPHPGKGPVHQVQRMHTGGGPLRKWSQNPLSTCHSLPQGLDCRQKQFRPLVRLPVPSHIAIYCLTWHRRPGLNLTRSMKSGHTTFPGLRSHLYPRCTLSRPPASRLGPMLHCRPWELGDSSFQMQLWGI